MPHRAAWLIALMVATASIAEAQPRVYVGGLAAADGGARGNIPGGALPSAGAVFGVWLSKGWALEVEAERAFRTTTAGSGEAVLIAFPPSPNPTYDEIQRYGIRTRDERSQSAGAGWSAHAVWRTRDPGRVNIGVLGGVSTRMFTTRLVRTTTFVSPLLNLPPGYRLPDERSARRMVAGGLDGGLLVLVRITGPLTIAPELRVTSGLITNDRYTVVRTGIRALWSF